MGFVRNFFSGVESQQHFKAAMDAGANHMLMSYLYVVKQTGNILQLRKTTYPDLKFMIDSGAHTLQVSMHKPPYNTWKQADLEKYVADYADWLDKNRKYVFAAVELDIAYPINVVAGKQPNDPYGDTIVDGWRKKYFLPLQQSGVNIIYVWHTSQGYQGWEDLCANFPYVGLPGEMSKQADFNTYLTVAKRYLTKVHGFAATKQSDFRDFPWYSIDSTTWKAGEIYGTLPVWIERNQKLKFVAKGEREPYRQVFDLQGLDANKIIQDTDYQEVTRSSLKSMVGMENFYKERFKNRVFYYELRMNTPQRIKGMTPERAKFLWRKKFLAEKCFPQHAHEKLGSVIKEYIHAIACVQYRDLSQLTAKGAAFLKSYFPAQMGAAIPDSLLLAKELAVQVSPGNEAALRRETEEDFADCSNPAKPRTNEIYSFDEDWPDWLVEQMLLQQD